jgi:hypothetical protein
MFRRSQALRRTARMGLGFEEVTNRFMAFTLFFFSFLEVLYPLNPQILETVVSREWWKFSCAVLRAV